VEWSGVVAKGESEERERGAGIKPTQTPTQAEAETNTEAHTDTKKDSRRQGQRARQ